MSEKFTFFWRGTLSQWAPSLITESSILYSCAEQYMMAKKAELFNDLETHEKIMNTRSPKEQQLLGRLVKNFNPDVWEENCKVIVYQGNFLKFDQNDSLKDVLFRTEGTTLVEASPIDKIWGIGLEEGDPRTLKRETWLGKNYLGEVLTLVREDLLNKLRLSYR